MKRGIDVSRFQGDIDWNRVKKSNIDFAILKIANIYDDEEIYYDTKFDTNYQACKSLNFPIGIYIYNYCNRIASLELNISKIIAKIKDKTFELPVFLDMEDKSILSEGKNYLSTMCNKFCEIVEGSSFVPGIYANLNWLNNYLDVSRFSNAKIWVAQYNNKCTYNKPYMLWQYSNTRQN